MIKYLGALIGFILYRFSGAIIGYLIGSFLDSIRVVRPSPDPTFKPPHTRSEDFSQSFLILTAAVLRADGTVTRSELDFVKELYKNNFGIDKTREDMLVLRDILHGEIPWESACYNINQNMVQSERIKLVHYLFGIAMADGTISGNELTLIRSISQKINLTQWDFEAIRSKFTGTYNRDFWEEFSGGSTRQQTTYRTQEDPYVALGITRTATDEEIKSAYRKLVIEHHPDKHASKSAEEIKAAEEKFKKVQQAYNEVKKERGL